jgi:hypothetical protein
MTWEEYAALPGVNFTILREGRRSAKHMEYRMKTQREDTIALGKGRAAHCLILTPDDFPIDFAVWRGEARRGRAWLDFEEANEGRTIIKATEYAHCIGMRDALHAHPIAGPLLASAGENEKVIQWTDEMTGVQCKARIDRVTEHEIIDLKTMKDVSARAFGQVAARLGYHVQLGFYRGGLRRLEMVRRPVIIAVEPLPPYDVAVYALGDEVLYAADEDWQELVRMVAAGQFSGRWPGRHEDGEVALELPGWCFPEVEGAADLGVIFHDSESEEPS